VQLFFVDVKRAAALEDAPITGGRVTGLLEHRAIPEGTPVFLDDESLRPVEPWCSWGRQIAWQVGAARTRKDYGRIVLRLSDHLRQRGKDLLSATESDLKSHEKARRELQRVPLGDDAWGKEAQLINQLYGWLVDQRYLPRRPLRLAAGGRNPLAPRVHRRMDIRHLTLDQYRYFRDVGLGGQLPDSRVDFSFRGWAPHRNRAAADLAVSTGMRIQEWSTVLLPELRIGSRRPSDGVEFAVQRCAKGGKLRWIFVPSGALDSIDTFMLLERPRLIAASAKRLKQRHRELFVVSRIEEETGRLHGVLDGSSRVFTMSKMDPELRRITVREAEAGLEALAVFIGHGGQMLGPSSWTRFRHAAWRRMWAHTGSDTPVLPDRRWRWHDLRHSWALQMLAYLEWQMDGDEPDVAARRRRHSSYLGAHIRHNPLLIVSRRLGHSSPAVTYQYLEYSDDAINDVEAAFAQWVGDDDEAATYAEIATRMLALESGRGRN
jgi:site-specific recombinase XerD